MLALMKKEEELLYTRKKNNGRHLSVQGTEKHMTLNIKTYDPMVLCATYHLKFPLFVLWSLFYGGFKGIWYLRAKFF